MKIKYITVLKHTKEARRRINKVAKMYVKIYELRKTA